MTELLATGEVPFQVVRSSSDSVEEGKGLSGQPAFSSILTVMAGTVKHPVTLDQSRTLPTISNDDTLTTRWPSHSSSQDSDMSSSSSSMGDSFRVPSGLIFTTPEKYAHILYLQAITRHLLMESRTFHHFSFYH